MIEHLHRLRSETRGTAAVELALISIPLFMLILGGMDFGYQAYVRAVTVGALETLSRQITLENVNETAARTELETQIKHVAPYAVIDIERGSVARFSNFDSLEPLTVDLNNNGQLDGPVDTDGNGVPDKSDCWRDIDDDGLRTVVDVGRDSIGGADDLVRFNVTVEYDRVLPIWRFLGVPQRAMVGASTVTRRQPFATQPTPVVRCA